jgi:signal peptidase II
MQGVVKMMETTAPRTASPVNKLMPFLLTLNIVVLDQMSKYFIVKHVPYRTIGAVFFGDFLRIIHARNPGIAFSLGRDLPDAFRSVLFTVLPIIVLTALVVYYFRTEDFTPLQRWSVAGILGGGAGNLIDRIFRPQGVVDFLDVKFFGLLGLDRWPTFNVADSSVVICGILLTLSMLIPKKDLP